MWEGPTTLLSGSCQAACDASGGTTAASSTVASAALPLRCARFGAELWAGEVPETGLECVQTQSCVPTLVCDHLQSVLLSRDAVVPHREETVTVDRIVDLGSEVRVALTELCRERGGRVSLAEEAAGAEG